jgi:hypothetical protein
VAGRRFDVVLKVLQGLRDNLGIGRDVVVQPGALSTKIIGGWPGPVVIRDFDSPKPIKDQLDLLAAQAKDTCDDVEPLYEQTGDLEAAHQNCLTRADFDVAVTAQLKELDALQNVSVVEDLLVAFVGIAITFTGVAFGLVAL